ncbi:MAG: hypothetical protein ACPL0A_00735 [Candidatus Micrarchaeia archaeon]
MVRWETIAEFAFIGGALLAILLGTVDITNTQMQNLILILGSIVGLVNIFDKQIERFTGALIVLLLSSITFYTLATMTTTPMLIFFRNLSFAVAMFTAPVAFILGFKKVYNIAMEYKNNAAETKTAKAKRRK